MEKLYSFDVFDTCLVRTFANPADLFYHLVERTLCISHGSCALDGKYGREEVSELARARVLAEKRAHEFRTQEDITLADIYAQFAELPQWGISADEMYREEIKIELETARPVVEILRRIESLQAAGKRVVYITDMYLPAEVIQQMLERCGYKVPEGSLYVSNQLGLTKRSGNLFRHILQQEGIAASQLLHCGDGIESDFLGARKAGVVGEVINYTHLNRFEKAVSTVPSEKPWIPGRIAGIMRSTRLGFTGPANLAPAAEIASSVIAPLLSGFVSWVIRDAQKRGLNRLYFVARDGQILHKIAKAFNIEGGPDIHYLYGSRQAWYLPSAFSANREELEFVLLPGQSSAPRHNLKRMNLTPEELSDSLAEYGFLPNSWDVQLPDSQIEKFWQFVEDPKVSAIVMQKAREARELATAYFEQEGLLKDDKWAIVDVGWTLRTQGSFRKILAAAGQSHTLGYYLGITKARFSALSYGQGRGYLLEEAEAEIGSQLMALFQNKGLIDQVFTMADHGSTRGYMLRNGRIVPELAELPPNPKREAFLEAIQGRITAFAAEYGRSFLFQYESELRESARLVAGMLIGKPTRAEARTLAWAPISDDPNELRAAPLARALSPVDFFKIGRDIIKRVRQGRQNKSRTVPSIFYKDLSWGFSWFEGSAALSPLLGGPALWSFNKLQQVRREKKTMAARPIVFWQQLFNLKKRRT